MMGIFSSLAQGLDAGGNFRDFDLAVFLAALAGGFQQLEVIDDDELDVVAILRDGGRGRGARGC